MEWLRFGLVTALLAAALITVLLSLLGVFRFRFVLNRMHAASILDTFGILLVAVALLVSRGLAAADWKLLLLVLLLWIGSPISGHLVSRLEVMTDEDLVDHVTVEEPGKGDTGDDNP